MLSKSSLIYKTYTVRTKLLSLAAYTLGGFRLSKIKNVTSRPQANLSFCSVEIKTLPIAPQGSSFRQRERSKGHGGGEELQNDPSRVTAFFALVGTKYARL